MKRVAFVPAFLIFLIILGFGKRGPLTTLEYKNEGVNLICYLKKAEIKNVSEEDKKIFGIVNDRQTVVFAKIHLTNASDKAQIINLGHYYLSWNNNKSSKIYIDSFVDYIITDKVLRPNETLDMDVYWVLSGELPQNEFGKLKLLYQKR